MSALQGQGAGIHATAVVYGETGALIVGPSGSGKSALALALLTRARGIAVFGALVGDDRVWVREIKGRLVASGSAKFTGLIEQRGVGLVMASGEPAAVIGLIVELSERGRPWPRLPDEPNVATVEGVRLPRLALDSGRGAVEQAVSVDGCLAALAASDAGRKGIRLNISPQCTKIVRLRARRTSEPAD